ncbi:MAG: DUF3786 domain-containing protein [Intestinibacter sp.]|uniref:DUF3786 domain-containing protein n=1 Tax=Intestinibacter sp. TaxID=1965304 RepID=UPI003F14F157
MNIIKVSNYEIQSDVAREAFLKFNHKDIAQKLDLKQDAEYLYVKFINQEYRLGKKSSVIQRIEDDSTYVDAGFYEIMSILDLLDNVGRFSKHELKASRNFVAPTGLKEVVNAGNTQRNSWIFSRNAKAFSGKLDKLEKACEEIGGVKIDKGDVGYIINIFDYIQLMFVYYDEDSDFEPEIKVLWTDNVLEFVHYETTYYMLEYLFEKILKIMDK